MENEIKQIIQNAKELRNEGYSDKQLAEFVHIELGKLIVYDNNYSVGFDYDINKNQNGAKTKTSQIRQAKMLSEKSNIKSKEQVCKGMAEIYTAILTELGVDAKVVAVQSKEEVEGEVREDGSVIDVPEIYSANFDSNYEIHLGENEKSNGNPIGHYYSIVKLDEGEFIQDFLTEKALTRIKIGETELGSELPGFHRKDEHRKRTDPKNDKISPEYVKKMQKELEEYMQETDDDTKVFDFIFEKLKEHIDEFGFEEAKEFVMMYAQSIIPRGMIKKESLIPINLVKEDEENCEVLCVYRYGEKNYMLRGGQDSTDLPIGKVGIEDIEKVFDSGFVPRKLSDAQIIQGIDKKKKRILQKQREIYQGDLEKEDNNGDIKTINIEELSDEELEKMCFHYSLKKDKNSIQKTGLSARVGRNSKGIDKFKSIYFSYGVEAVLETWDVWLKWRANRLYHPYWQEENKEIQQAINNGTATEQEKREYYYKCQKWNEDFSSGKYKEDSEKIKFLYDFQIDEMLASNYYILDLKEGGDFTFDEIDVKKRPYINMDRNSIKYKIFNHMLGNYTNFESEKVDKWNMNTILGKELTIEPERIKQIMLSNGKNDVLSIVTFLYDRYKEITPKEKQVQFDLLDGYMEHVKDKIKNSELPHFDRNDKIDEHDKIVYFHSQKTEGDFSDRTVSFTEQEIGKATVDSPIKMKKEAEEVTKVTKMIEKNGKMYE